MSNFLTGVVRRGAGLSMPVTVRPARGPEHVPVLAPTVADALQGNEDGSVLSERLTTPSLGESTVQSAVRPEPGNETSFVAPSPIASRPKEIETPLSVQPRAEISRLDIEQRVAVRAPADPWAGAQPGGVVRDSAEVKVAITPMKDAKPRTEELRTSQMQPGVRPAIETSAPMVQRLSPKQERQVTPPTLARAESPRASDSGSASKASPEKKSINVKIGRVEIRSAQAAPVVQRPRANTSSGFDDARVSRLYLDRNMR